MEFVKLVGLVSLNAIVCFESALANDSVYVPIPYRSVAQAQSFDLEELQRILNKSVQDMMYINSQIVAPPVRDQSPSIGYFSNGKVEWWWVNGNRFDMNSCDDRIKLKKFVTEGRHNVASQMQMPSGYDRIPQVSFEAYALHLDCTFTQKAIKALGK